jgi:hypothetical protein
MESVGICLRCGEQVCEVCRTRWRGKIVCAACIDRALATREANPEQARSHRRAAMRSLYFGLGAWLLSAVALTVLQLAGIDAPVLLTFGVFSILSADVLVASLGVGQAVAALRTGGENVLHAAGGLLLGGAYVGLMLGVGVLFVWQN